MRGRGSERWRGGSALVAVLVCAASMTWWHHTFCRLPPCRKTSVTDVEARSFAVPSSFGRAGLSHLTLHGARLHGAKEVEVWQQAFAPGAATPIHRHPCEEVFVVLQGSGELRTRAGASPFGSNTTLVVPANVIHQLVNTGPVLLQVLVVISNPPIVVDVYSSWNTSRSRRVFPYTFDTEPCT